MFLYFYYHINSKNFVKKVILSISHKEHTLEKYQLLIMINLLKPQEKLKNIYWQMPHKKFHKLKLFYTVEYNIWIEYFALSQHLFQIPKVNNLN